MGNKLRLNKKISDAICQSLRNGNYLSTSARAVGLSEATVRNWIARGSSHDGETIFKTFVDDVERAQAQAELKSLNSIVSSDDWRAHAWILEHGVNKARFKSDDIATPQVVAVNTLIENLRERTTQRETPAIRNAHDTHDARRGEGLLGGVGGVGGEGRGDEELGGDGGVDEVSGGGDEVMR